MSILPLAQPVRSGEKPQNSFPLPSKVAIVAPRSAPARPTYFAWTEAQEESLSFLPPEFDPKGSLRAVPLHGPIVRFASVSESRLSCSLEVYFPGDGFETVDHSFIVVSNLPTTEQWGWLSVRSGPVRRTEPGGPGKGGICHEPTRPSLGRGKGCLVGPAEMVFAVQEIVGATAIALELSLKGIGGPSPFQVGSCGLEIAPRAGDMPNGFGTPS